MGPSERWWRRLLGGRDGGAVGRNGTGQAERVDREWRAVVVGGGLAGVAAATVLAERGVGVHLLEREAELGGRVRGWDDRLATGEPFQMERGFHAFFRQYYNVRALLGRLDHMGPGLRHLVPLDDYPLLGPGGRSESFSGLPTTAPFNVIELVRRTPSLSLRDLVHVDARAALEMLRYEPERTYARFDGRTAKDYLDSLRFPSDARRMLFDVFAHSFFNPEERMSAAELLMMFHFYFMGNREGLVFDVLDEPFSTCLWRPFQRYLERLGVTVELGCAAEGVARVEGEGRKAGAGGAGGARPRWRVHRADSAPLEADAVVLAVTVPALKTLVDASPDLDDPEWRRAVAELDVTLPFAVWRLWLDGPLRPDRAPFAGTAGCGILDNISVYERFQGESRRWAEQTGGSIVELHAYAVPEGYDEAGIKAEMKRYLEALYPEARESGPVDERFILARDCPAFAPGSCATRPTVETPFEGVALAGDFVRLTMPSALMERAVTSGFRAANRLLAGWEVRGEPVLGIPPRGLLARPRLGRRRTG